MSSWDNRRLWERYDFNDYGLIGECYLSIDYTKVAYLTDTGRTWNDTAANVRDRISVQQDLGGIVSTDDLISALEEDWYGHWLVQTHPQRWARTGWEWPFYFAHDTLANSAKRVLVPLRNLASRDSQRDTS